MRSPNPVDLTATPMTRPPKISHSAADSKPAKTTGAGATFSNMAAVKKNTAVIGSGITLVAQRPMAATVSARTRLSVGGSG